MAYETYQIYLKVQLFETQRLLELIKGHPLMSISLKHKEQELIEKLEKHSCIPKELKENVIDPKPNNLM